MKLFGVYVCWNENLGIVDSFPQYFSRKHLPVCFSVENSDAVQIFKCLKRGFELETTVLLFSYLSLLVGRRI